MGIPVRTCTGCGMRRPKSEMIRVAVDGEGKVSITGDRRTSGRGSYVCPDKKCVELAHEGGGMHRGLGVKVPDSIFEELELTIDRQRGTSG